MPEWGEGRPKQSSNTKDAHFIMLSFMTASSDTAVCGIIYSAKGPDPLWVQ